MDASSYFLPKTADEADLTAWSAILPAQARVLRTNLFGDVFTVDNLGVVYMLERGACSAHEIAPSEDEFWRRARDDTKGWQLRTLVDECRSAGKVLEDGQCYAFTTLPALGGAYAVDNVWVADWQEWFAFTADVFEQIKDLQDGATVTFKAVD